MAEAIRIVRFEPWHLAMIAPGAVDLTALEGVDLSALGGVHAAHHMAFTALAGTAVLGSAGVALQWRGVGTAWLLVSDRLRAHPLFMTRAVIRGIRKAEADLDLHRLQITVRAGYEAASRWAERLGFVFEGEMPGYGPNGETHLRYARVGGQRPEGRGQGQKNG